MNVIFLCYIFENNGYPCLFVIFLECVDFRGVRMSLRLPVLPFMSATKYIIAVCEEAVNSGTNRWSATASHHAKPQLGQGYACLARASTLRLSEGLFVGLGWYRLVRTARTADLGDYNWENGRGRAGNDCFLFSWGVLSGTLWRSRYYGLIRYDGRPLLWSCCVCFEIPQYRRRNRDRTSRRSLCGIILKIKYVGTKKQTKISCCTQFDISILSNNYIYTIESRKI